MRPGLSGKKSSVQQDWRSWLPSEKAEVFGQQVRRLECFYGMFSVALNDAIELRQTGKLAKSCQAIGVLPPLCARLAHPLGALLHSLGEHAKHYGTVPNAAPLDPQNFQTIKGQRSARMSGLLSKVLLSQRTQFLHKLGTLLEMVENLGKEYCASAEELGTGLSTDPFLLWKTIDAAHYDLNTCLREAIVLLKSFLLVLPQDQLGTFEKSVCTQAHDADDPAHYAKRLMRHRRFAAVGGE